jgi:hypothetical protein
MAQKFLQKPFIKKVLAINPSSAYLVLVIVLSVATLGLISLQPSSAASSRTVSLANSLYLVPSRERPNKGGTVDIKLMANSGQDTVNAVQTKVIYPADKLEFYGIQEGSAFPVVAATNAATPGEILIGRGAELGSEGTAGQHEVLTLTFKVLEDNVGSSQLRIDRGFSMLVRSSDNANILAETLGAPVSSER